VSQRTLTRVAPLDFGTSLIGSRDPVATLSASVDSLARRNVISLTNESTRSMRNSTLKYTVYAIRLHACAYIIEKCVHEFEEIHPSTLQAFRMGLTRTGVILSTLDSDLEHRRPSSFKNC
ncbi:hypothetical protein F4604DRAFT_1813711, partial [Suillus subluteus]